MAVSADHCRISLSAPSQWHRAAGAPGRNKRLVKFCSGEMMGKKLNLPQLQLGGGKTSRVGKHVCMSIAVDIAGEAKLGDIDIGKRNPRTVVAIILGGGAGTRLFPLTKRRAKPAVPIGGAYRLIDVPMSNCINSGINKVYILTQFNSASLNRHISRAYNFGSSTSFGDGYVELLKLPARQGRGGSRVLQMPSDSSIGFLRWRFPTANDFGSEIIPASAKEFFIKAYLFNDYWEDIGTIRSFFEANLALTEHVSKADPPNGGCFYGGRSSFCSKPMYTSRRNLPPSKIDNSKIVDSIISHGSFLTDSFIEHSVVGIRSRINSNVHLKDTVMLGADYYETDSERVTLLAEGRVPVGIGENTKIKDCIIDKNARIGKNVVIANSEGVQEADRSLEGFYIRSGITILLKNSTIVDGLVI
ncbi:hypothetical protein DVH24_041524 [Malus domestica]|uniref:glucose-1-phosphate adenylyltransferase n=1 Tax=Malus domestica TaxID=3750 RepID=A0A498IEJ3_MALDO|nr:hypothetical protein DVH24_041524 [Malus domestica]